MLIRKHSFVGTILLVGVTACSSAGEPPVAPPPAPVFSISSAFGIAASTAAVRDPNPRIRYSVIVTNGSASDETVSYRGCWAIVHLFATADRTGTPKYDSGTGSTCASPDTRVTIPAGQSADLVGFIEVSAVVAAGVPAGHYYVNVLVSPNGSETEIAAGEIDIQP